MSNLMKPGDELPLRVTFKRYQSDVGYMAGGRLRLCAALMLLFSMAAISAPVSAAGEDIMPLNVTAWHDSTAELTMINWSNPLTGDITALGHLRDATYEIWRGDSPFNTSFIAWADRIGEVEACPSSVHASGTNLGACSDLEHQFNVTVPVDTDGVFYYKVTSSIGNDNHLYDGQSGTESDSVIEHAEPIRTPYLVNAVFDVETGNTTITWINANELGMNFPEWGNLSISIKIYRHEQEATHSNWAYLDKDLLANLTPREPHDASGVRISSWWYHVNDKSWPSQESYYTVTYWFPDNQATNDTNESYEDTRFESSNTFGPIAEDAQPPEDCTQAIGSFTLRQTEPITGFTTLQWARPADLPSTYRIYRSPQNFTSTTDDLVEFVKQIDSSIATPSTQVDVSEGVARTVYYGVVAVDEHGNEQTNIVWDARVIVEEDTLSDYIPLPTNVQATYDGQRGITVVTWNDALYVQGETYTVWRSVPVLNKQLGNEVDLDLGQHMRIVEGFENYLCENDESLEDQLPCAVVAIGENIAEGSGTFEFAVDQGKDHEVFYAVTVEYRTWCSVSSSMEDEECSDYADAMEPIKKPEFSATLTGNSMVDPIREDGIAPIPVRFDIDNTEVDGLEARILLKWLDNWGANDRAAEYYIYRWDGVTDPFILPESNMSQSETTLDAQVGWTNIFGPIAYIGPEMTVYLNIPASNEREVYYAVVSVDTFGNIQDRLVLRNPEDLMNDNCVFGCNVLKVREDTLPPSLEFEIRESSSTPATNSLVGGLDYQVRVYPSEALDSDGLPVISIKTAAGGEYLLEKTECEAVNDVSGTLLYYMTTMAVPTLPKEDLEIWVELADVAGNPVNFSVEGYSFDGVPPSLELYAPSQDTVYLYGEDIIVYGAATDDMNVTSVEFKVNDGEWMQVMDVTPSTIGPEQTPYLAFTSTILASSLEPSFGEHKLYFKVRDEGGNAPVFGPYTFTTDFCAHNATGYLECESTVDRTPKAMEEPPGYVPKLGDANYMLAYGAICLNMFLMLFTILIAISAATDPRDKKKKKAEDEDEVEDWMKDFMGGGSSDLRSGLDSSPTQDLEQAKSLDEGDEDDELTPIKVSRRRRSDDDDEDEDEDERPRRRRSRADDYDDDDDEPVVRRPTIRSRRSRDYDDDDEDEDDDYDDYDDEDDEDDEPRRRPPRRRSDDYDDEDDEDDEPVRRPPRRRPRR